MQNNNKHIDDKINAYRTTGKGTDFSVPENYFNKLQTEVQQKVNGTKKDKWRLWLTASAGICCLLFAYFLLPNNIQNDGEDIANISVDYIGEFFIQNPDAITIDEIAEVVSNETLNVLSAELNLNGVGSSYSSDGIDDLNNEAIFEYLIDEGIEEEAWDYL